MTNVAVPDRVTCPNCGAAVAPGRFCLACGAPLDPDPTTGAVAADALGLRRVSLRNYGHTAWLAIARPAELSTRWIRGQRAGLVSPTAMMAGVTVLTALAGFLMTKATGVRAESGALYSVNGFVKFAPFVKALFPQTIAAASLDPSGFTSQFQQVSGRFAAGWPALFVAPGWLSLAPWRRIAQRGALIFALVETVFLFILAGVHTALKLVAPTVMDSPLVFALLGVAVFIHGALHVRALTGSGWTYALTRPVIAALLLMPVFYLWLLFLLIVTLAAWT